MQDANRQLLRTPGKFSHILDLPDVSTDGATFNNNTGKAPERRAGGRYDVPPSLIGRHNHELYAKEQKTKLGTSRTGDAKERLRGKGAKRELRRQKDYLNGTHFARPAGLNGGRSPWPHRSSSAATARLAKAGYRGRRIPPHWPRDIGLSARART